MCLTAAPHKLWTWPKFGPESQPCGLIGCRGATCPREIARAAHHVDSTGKQKHAQKTSDRVHKPPSPLYHSPRYPNIPDIKHTNRKHGRIPPGAARVDEQPAATEHHQSRAVRDRRRVLPDFRQHLLSVFLPSDRAATQVAKLQVPSK
jgi:hypothetical protein